MMKTKRRLTVSLSALTVSAVTAATVMAVSFCIVIFASVYSSALTQSAKSGAEQVVSQASIAINNNLDSMRSQLYNIEKMIRQSKSENEFPENVNALVGIKNEIYSVTVYDGSGKIILCAGSRYPLKKNIYKDLSFNKQRFDNAPDFSVSRPHVQTIFEGAYPWVVTAALKTSDKVFGSGEYIAVDFSFTQLADYVDKVGVGRHGYCYITDMGGNIIYHPQQQVLFSGSKTEDTTEIVTLRDGVHAKDDRIISVSTTSDGLWRIIGISFTGEMAKEKATQIITSIAASLFCCAAVAIIVLIIYQKIVNEPVSALIRAMKTFETQADAFVYSPKPETVKELQVLSDSFAHMSHRIIRLVERVRREETELRKTELKALQAQINPHFLYNTLDSIQWMCEQGKNEDASQMVGALARLFRISISKGHELIPIKDVLQHAKNYLLIQSYRYRNQFSYRFDIDRSLENYLCNKITIQPLIENAIYHGLDRMVDEGEIVVTLCSAPDDQNDILIKVEDNGVGMTKEQCEKILQKQRSDSSGIGVKNVNDRLKIYFGSKYGLTIESEQDVGTIVTVRIPKIDKEA